MAIYGTMFWKKSIYSNKGFVVQKKILVLVLIRRCTSFLIICIGVFRLDNILPLSFAKICFVKLILSKFMICNMITTIQHKRKNLFNYPVHRTTIFEASPYYSGIRLYQTGKLGVSSK